MTDLWCELALVSGLPQAGVRLEVEGGRFTSIEVGVDPGGATQLPGFTIPGLANTHSHAFHRALRSRTQTDRGTFWTWRDLMYRAAARLDPGLYRKLAAATFAEMAMAGITCVGEFHYLHHQPDGVPYLDRNEMGNALLAAADDAGIRISLLDTLYLHGGLTADGYQPPSGTQKRFSDGSAEQWMERVGLLQPGESQRIGAAVHSVRAVDQRSMAEIEPWLSASSVQLHAHVSEQRAENTACLEHSGLSPVGVLAEAGLISERFSAIHATHLTESDIKTLAASDAAVVMCPTTERDLGDGIGPTAAFSSAGVPMALGSDSHAVIDMFVEARALELDERLRAEERGVHQASDLLASAAVIGHRCLGWPDAGEIAVGYRADLATVAMDSVRTAGGGEQNAIETTVFGATAADVTSVFVDGKNIVAEGRHMLLDVTSELDDSIRKLMDDE